MGNHVLYVKPLELQSPKSFSKKSELRLASGTSLDTPLDLLNTNLKDRSRFLFSSCARYKQRLCCFNLLGRCSLPGRPTTQPYRSSAPGGLGETSLDIEWIMITLHR